MAILDMITELAEMVQEMIEKGATEEKIDQQIKKVSTSDLYKLYKANKKLIFDMAKEENVEDYFDKEENVK